MYENELSGIGYLEYLYPNEQHTCFIRTIMLYPVIATLAIILHLIINHDFVFKSETRFRATAYKDYHIYLGCVLIYFITDALWGFCEYLHYPHMLYIDTFFYYIAAVFTVVFWCRYVISYLKLKDKVSTLLNVVCTGCFIVEIIVLIVNLFVPVFFWVEPDGTYHGGDFRYIAYAVQIVLFVSIGIMTLRLARHGNGLLKKRYVMFCIFSFSMVVCIIAQGFFPLLPLYTLGLMLGTCELRVFVLEDDKDEFRRQIMAKEKKLKESTDIISNAGFGIWKIKTGQDGRKMMEANSKLQDILGIKGMNLGPEELYSYFHSRIINDRESIESDDYESMRHGELKSRIVSWNHPTKGHIFLSAGGARYIQSDGEDIISGYCGDITLQRKKELRSSLIINTLARSYEFVNYVIMETGRFTSTNNAFYPKGHDQNEGDVFKAIDQTCSQHISPDFRDEMRAFSDLSTINERMKELSVIINQFKDTNEVWHEWSYIVVDRNEDGTIKHLIWAVRKIEDEKRAEMRRQQILDDNIAANKAKSMFLQNMSHEIRTPINAMFGFAQLLGLPDGSWTDEEREQYNSHIYNNYKMLEMLINDIIEAAESEHGNYSIEVNDVCVNSVCRNALMSVEYRTPEDVKLYFTSDLSDEDTVRSDGRRIQQVLINYLSNACKHTQQGEIHLHCSTSENPGKLTFSVTDTGEGVPAEKADIIFNRFTKLNQFVQGTGLGLNICLTIANLLDGEVFLDTSYTSGARFVFIIPLS